MTETHSRIALVCATCGSIDLTRDALTRWSVEQQRWELRGLLDSVTCEQCGEETRTIEVEVAPTGT